MTTLAEHAEMLRKWADVLEIPSGRFVNDDLRAAADALSSIPAQAVGVKARTSAWLAYWPGAGSIDSVTRVTRSEHEAKRWRDDGAEVTELVERSLPSQPAAVAVTDEMVEAMAAHIGGGSSISMEERLEMARAGLEAALRSTP